MSRRTASTLSVILSLVLLFIFAVLTAILEMIALNGVPEKQGMTAMTISLICLGAGAFVLGLLAWRATGFLMTRFQLHPILAVTLTVALGLLLSGMIALFSILISIPMAGIK